MIHWNFKDASLGTVLESSLCLPPLDPDQTDTQPLLFTTFMVAPLLPMSSLYIEQKFSGSNEAGKNVDDIG